jgi:hypothetical protein
MLNDDPQYMAVLAESVLAAHGEMER